MNDPIKHHRQLLALARTWACQHLPGWTDEAHRDLIARHGATEVDGRMSATTLTAPQLQAALADYEARGWVRHRRVFKGNDSATRKVPPHIAHLVRLWARLGQAGKVRDAGRPALLAWVARQVGRTVPNLDALTTEEGQRLIEALKSWSAR